MCTCIRIEYDCNVASDFSRVINATLKVGHVGTDRVLVQTIIEPDMNLLTYARMDVLAARTKVIWLTGFNQNRQEESGILETPEAYTHTSAVLFEAKTASHLPNIEMHLSKISNRDVSMSASNAPKAANGMIYGFGSQSYESALDAMRGLIHTPS
jgi:3-dehydroquinate dehydratase-2